MAVSGAQQRERLNKAMAAREVIGQAEGILMERHKLTADQAFTVLSRASQHSDTKLIDVARALTDTGELAQPAERFQVLAHDRCVGAGAGYRIDLRRKWQSSTPPSPGEGLLWSGRNCRLA